MELKNVEMGQTYDTYVKLIGILRPDLYWYGDGLVQMGEAAPVSEFRNLSVSID